MCNVTESEILNATCYVYNTQPALRDHTKVDLEAWCTAIQKELVNRGVLNTQSNTPALRSIGLVSNYFREAMEAALSNGVFTITTK